MLGRLSPFLFSDGLIFRVRFVCFRECIHLKKEKNLGKISRNGLGFNQPAMETDDAIDSAGPPDIQQRHERPVELCHPFPGKPKNEMF